MRVYSVVSICLWLGTGCAADASSLLTKANDSGAADRDAAPTAADPVYRRKDRGDAGHEDAAVAVRDAESRGVVDAAVDAGAQQLVDAGAVAPEPQPEPLDAGSHGLLDAGTASGELDAGHVDAGHVDAGHVVDAAVGGGDSGSGSGGSDAGVTDAGSVDAGSNLPDCAGPPGLYSDTKCQVLSAGIEAYQPQYPLWSDGAKKQRYIYLPAGTHIDTTNPDRWTFPVGTRLYKSFAAGAVLVETRVMEKVAAGVGFDKWTLASYAWSADQHSVSPADPNGVVGALGTNLDIPSQANCRSCHNMTGADAVIGFNAIQLNHSLTGLALPELLMRGLLVNDAKPAQPNITLAGSLIPGDAVTRAGLGYLHGNCGHCHGGPEPRAGQSLWSIVGMTDVSDAPLMQTADCHCLDVWRGRSAADGQPYTLRVAPSHAVHSGIIGRMSSRVRGEQMPPIGTNQTDVTGLGAVRAFIDSLDGTACDAAPPVCLN